MELKDIRYIAVDGPIGAGKSSLARILAMDLGARPVLENPDANPFLPAFYESPEQFAFQTQLYFLLSRYRQQKDLVQPGLFDQKQVVCDYLFAKDLLFAKMNLSEEEYDLYVQIYRLLDQKLPKPNLTIYLQATPDVLHQRIHQRQKDYETGISPEYIQAVSQNYSQFFFSYTDSPLLVVNVSGIDFVHEKLDYQMLKDEIISLIKSGKDRHYVTIMAET